jgi:cytochrome c peroxidase
MKKLLQILPMPCVIKKYGHLGYFLLIAFLFVLSCRKDQSSDMTPTPYQLEMPTHFPQMPIPADNPLTVEGVELGRHLFYDKLLSRDNSVSCASCHHQVNAFSDPNVLSIGIDGLIGSRQSMALVNMGWQQFFFWDGRVSTLEEQIFHPVLDPVEMDNTWSEVVKRLRQHNKYPQMFYKAFGEPGIDSVKASKAIAQFIRTMVSAESKFDLIYKWANGIPLSTQEAILFQQITPEELAGYDLFMSLNGADCMHCHNGPLMQVQIYSNNGLDAEFSDIGRMGVTGNPNDKGRFKVPTLRNIGYTAPYMHDGRFATLEEVIDHYSHGLVWSPTIDTNMEFISHGGVQLSAQEKIFLKAFLLTLNDPKFITNPKFSNPH